MAEDQVTRLYGKSVAIFPPPGLDCDDSYFARTVPLDVRPGRLYLGYLAPGFNRRQSMIPLAATLMAAPEALFGNGHINGQELLEAWWTLVGPVSVTALFVFVSLPLIEKRMKKRRPDYEQVIREVSCLVPWFPEKR